MSAQKMRQIQRNLAEQQSFVQSIMQQRQKKPKASSSNNILSSSIQKAKQKINNEELKPQLPHSQKSQNLALSRQKKTKVQADGSFAIASAMKKLQQKISSLQLQNNRLAAQCKEARKKQMADAQKKQELHRLLQENKRKIKNLQLSLENDKNEIKQLHRKNSSLDRETIHTSALRIQQLERRLASSQLALKAKEHQHKNTISECQLKQRKLLQIENRRKQSQIRYQEQSSMLMSLNRQIQMKLAQAQERCQLKDILIQNLKNDIKNNSGLGAFAKSSNIAKMGENQIQMHLDKDKTENKKKTACMENTENIQIQQLKNRYQQLLRAYKNLDQKLRHQKNQSKNYRNKFWQLKQCVQQLIQKLQGLPNGILSHLKILIVKINKIQAYSTEYFAATPTKKSLKNSIFSKTERSRSNSKKKISSKGKIDLNQSNTSTKSKGSSHTNRSSQSHKKQKSNEKSKKVVVSNKCMKRSEISELEVEVQQIRKRYKDLVNQLRNNDDGNQQIREELNSMASLLNEKSEQLTKLKKK